MLFMFCNAIISFRAAFKDVGKADKGLISWVLRNVQVFTPFRSQNVLNDNAMSWPFRHLLLLACVASTGPPSVIFRLTLVVVLVTTHICPPAHQPDPLPTNSRRAEL
jgi:hypothetical protein